MITVAKIVVAHYKALYWKNRMQVAERHMRKYLKTLATVGSGKHETEHGFFTVSENNKYPADEIKAKLTPKQRALCMTLKWDQEKARVNYPEIYQSVKKREGYKVSI